MEGIGSLSIETFESEHVLPTKLVLALEIQALVKRDDNKARASGKTMAG